MIITNSIKVCGAKHVAMYYSLGQGHNFDSKSVSHTLIMGSVSGLYLLKG